MAPMRLLLAGMVVVGLLFVAGVLLVLAFERGARRADQAASPPAAPEVPGGTARRPDATPVAAAPPASNLRPSDPPPPARGSASAGLPASMEERVKALEPLRLEVTRGLAEHEGRIEACRLRGVELVVTLETLDRRVRVLDVAPRGADGGTDASGGVAPPQPDEEAVRCVRGALGRTVFAAPSAAPGRTWQMSYVAGSRP